MHEKAGKYETYIQKHTHGEDGGHVHAHGDQHGNADGHVHTHGDQHGNAGGHVHTHGDQHEHPHVHPNSKAVSNRLAKAIGHLEAVKRMVDRGEDCSQILIQLAAVRSAINNAGKVILMDHLNHCIVDAVEDGDLKKLEEFSEAIERFVK